MIRSFNYNNLPNASNTNERSTNLHSVEEVNTASRGLDVLNADVDSLGDHASSVRMTMKIYIKLLLLTHRY